MAPRVRDAWRVARAEMAAPVPHSPTWLQRPAWLKGPRLGAALRPSRPAAAVWPRWLSGAAVCGLALIASLALMTLDSAGPHLPLAGAEGGAAVEAMASAQTHLGTALQGTTDSGFVPVASGEPWQRLVRRGEPMAAWLVQSDMPRERLAALGLPFDPARAGETVRAELLLHATGVVLAVRVAH